jgi:alpha-beta hydrolase superfamily lysophospholipase
MGGAGALHLGTKYHEIWAAVGVTAPAAGALQPAILETATQLPMIFIQGDADEAVSVEANRRWAAKMNELHMTYEYHEIPGGTHTDAIAVGAPQVFAFFDRHRKVHGDH